MIDTHPPIHARRQHTIPPQLTLILIIAHFMFVTTYDLRIGFLTYDSAVHACSGLSPVCIFPTFPYLTYLPVVLMCNSLLDTDTRYL
ncbi:hypothetical protein B0H12DRAFT_1143043 [Mycena haematopus]|nr:hypothetical protein B0H12DRAFT_1143043 [Mycena haematopus]